VSDYGPDDLNLFTAGRTRAVEQVVTIEVTGAKEGLIVGPRDVLVLSFPGYTSVDELEIIRRSLMNAGMDGRFILIGGQVNMSKMEPGDALDQRSRRQGGPARTAFDEARRWPGDTQFPKPGQGRLLGSTVEGEVL
jgi:hypothetical protein